MVCSLAVLIHYDKKKLNIYVDMNLPSLDRICTEDLFISRLV